MKPVRFVGDALAELRAFRQPARHDAGYQLHRVQSGEQPADYKPMPTIGNGVEELRVRDATGRTVFSTPRATPTQYPCCTHSRKSQNARLPRTSNWHGSASNR